MPPVAAADAVADAFAAEDVDTFFALMGNGNLQGVVALSRVARAVHVRHEHAAVTMAEGYARATGRVGVATVTNGPGFTQIMTALTVAARASLPLVILAGDSPLDLPWSLQAVDQSLLTLATGALYIPVRSSARLRSDVREAFYRARTERRPVVIGLPEDMQKQPVPDGHYRPAPRLEPAAAVRYPDPAQLDRVADLISTAQRPILLAGRGAIDAGARAATETVADRCGALLATSLGAKGLFDDHPFDIGVAGGLSTPLARELCGRCDLLVSVGARLGHYTTEAGKLFASATRIQIDREPTGLHEAVTVADHHLRGDADLAMQGLRDRLAARGLQERGFRTPDLARRLETERTDDVRFPIPLGTIDPRAVLRELDDAVPKDWDVVCGVGHFFFVAMAGLRGRHPRHYHLVSEFGTIGSALSVAAGVAAARGDGKVLLIDGDGGFIMHIQELDTIRRHGIRLLMTVMNDGAFGAELHKLTPQGHDEVGARHGRGALADVARAFGLAASTVTEPGALAAHLATYADGATAMLLDLHVADTVRAPQYRS